MPALPDSLCYQAVKRIDIQPVLDVMDRLAFVHLPHKGNYAGALACDVVPRGGIGPVVTDWIETLGLGGETARAILRRLAPRQNIPPHTDEWMPGEADWRRFQVPLVTHPDVIMRWPDDGQEVHLEAGWLWEVRFDRLHEVVHGADVPRVHLQIDRINATI